MAVYFFFNWKGFLLACQNLCLDNAGKAACLMEQFFQRNGQVGYISGDGYNCAAVGGSDGVDVLNICVAKINSLKVRMWIFREFFYIFRHVMDTLI